MIEFLNTILTPEYVQILITGVVSACGATCIAILGPITTTLITVISTVYKTKQDQDKELSQKQARYNYLITKIAIQWNKQEIRDAEERLRDLGLETPDEIVKKNMSKNKYKQSLEVAISTAEALLETTFTKDGLDKRG